MSVTTTISTKRPEVLSSEGWPTCCGLAPEVLSFRGRGFRHVAVFCQNPACERSEERGGVQASDVDIRAKWERYRNGADR